MSKILLDTNAYSHFLRGDQRVYNRISDATTIFMSVIVIAELYCGFKGGSKEIGNKKNLKSFLNKPSVDILPVTITTAEIFSEIKTTLKAVGLPIPINDAWIASHVVETGSVLISYDQHFKSIPGLRLWDESLP